jgi:hypothetical protein
MPQRHAQTWGAPALDGVAGIRVMVLENIGAAFRAEDSALGRPRGHLRNAGPLHLSAAENMPGVLVRMSAGGHRHVWAMAKHPLVGERSAAVSRPWPRPLAAFLKSFHREAGARHGRAEAHFHRSSQVGVARFAGSAAAIRIGRPRKPHKRAPLARRDGAGIKPDDAVVRCRRVCYRQN